MNGKQVIAVVGATGMQGGGLVRAIVDDPASGFAARALVRDVKSEKAIALARMGAEVVAADVDDEASLERAFRGAHGAYCVTFFWAHFSPDKELAHAASMARAARAAGVGHVVWSTLEDTRRWVPASDPRMPTLMGRYKVPHFDAKGEADARFRESGVPTTYLLTSFYWDNLIHFGMGPRRSADGQLAFTLPLADKKLPGIAGEDIGRCAYGVFQRGAAMVGRTVGIAGEHLTGPEMAAGLTRALGQPVRFQDIAPQAYRQLGFPGAEDLGNMFHVQLDFNAEFCAARDVELARGLHPGLQSFDTWLARNKTRIPIG